MLPVINFSLLLALLVVIFVIFPIVFMYSLTIQTFIMFPNIEQFSHAEYTNFTKHGIEGVRNMHVTVYDTDDETLISLGVWHVLPEIYREASKNDTFSFDDALNSTTHDVIIYCHGSSKTRIHWVPMYEVLRTFFHVIAVDYRSYGDSSEGQLTEENVVNDLEQLYRWVREKTFANIYIWGHSLGSALSTHTVSVLRNENIAPKGLILQAPFTTMREAISNHPIGKIFSWLPWFSATFLNPLERNGFNFTTATHILNVDSPIMILHAEDDFIVPYALGKKLSEIASTQRNLTFQGNVTYHQFRAELEYNYLDIYKAPELPLYIGEFINICNAYDLGKG